MKSIHSMIAALALVFVLPAAADAAAGDPEVIIYRFPGVHDDGSAAEVGAATVFFCTNFSGVIETLRFVTRQSNSTLAGNSVFGIGHLSTISVATHATAAYLNEANLVTGSVNFGTTAIAATSTNIICTAMTIDAANPKPTGVALRGIRFSPVPGSQE